MSAALLERLENATGPDRTLDAEIMFDLYAKPVGDKEDGGPAGYLWPEDNSSWSFGIRFPGKDRAWFADRRKGHKETLLIERDGALVLMNSLRIPELTGSLDAAMSLVPEGCDFWEMRHQSDWAAGKYRAVISGQRASYAATPALALTIAALRAHQTAAEREGGGNG